MAATYQHLVLSLVLLLGQRETPFTKLKELVVRFEFFRL